MTKKLLCGLALLCASCIDSSLSPVTLELRAEARGEARFEARDGWQVELTTATLLFGPLYLCPAPQAGDLCDIARAEFLEAATIDALATGAQPLGQLAGVSGVVRSAMWEYGRPWPIAATEAQPLVPGESSLHIVGVARRGIEEEPFDLRIEIEPSRAGVVSVRAAELFNTALVDGQSVVVETDVEAWLQGVDWSLFSEDEEQARQALISALVLSARPTLRIEP
ncbi:MAG: hypothetical protein ACI9KE_005370 [Polyangiales bacterium]|jgi:hypothetical protein